MRLDRVLMNEGLIPVRNNSASLKAIFNRFPNIMLKNTENNIKAREKGGRIKANKVLDLTCKNHGDENIQSKGSMTVNAMNKIINTSRSNPCDVENKIKNKTDAFDSNQERSSFSIINKFVQNNPVLNGCIVKPIEGLGKKYKFKENIQSVSGRLLDADIFIQYSDRIKKAFDNTKEGLAVLVDGINHQYNYTNAEFNNDSERLKAANVHLLRINIIGDDDEEIKEKDNEFIQKAVVSNLNRLVKYVNDISSDRDYHSAENRTAVKGNNDLKTDKQLKHELNRETMSTAKQDMLNRLIIDLHTKSLVHGNKEVSYINKDGKKDTLYNYLENKNKYSYFKFPDEWKKIAGTNGENLATWKAKHQAKDGEALYSADAEGNHKLFEDKNNPAK